MFQLISGSFMRLQLSLREVYGSLRASLRGVEVLRTVLKHFSEFQEVSRASEVAGSFMGRFKVFEGILANFSRVREKSKKFSGGFLKGFKPFRERGCRAFRGFQLSFEVYGALVLDRFLGASREFSGRFERFHEDLEGLV